MGVGHFSRGYRASDRSGAHDFRGHNNPLPQGTIEESAIASKLAASENREQEREDQTQEDTRHDGEVERRVPAPNDDIAWKASDADGQPVTQSEQQPSHYQYNPEDEQHPSQTHTFKVHPDTGRRVSVRAYTPMC